MAIILKSVQEFWKIKRGKLLKKKYKKGKNIFNNYHHNLFLLFLCLVLFCFVFFWGGGGGRGKDVKFWLTFKIVSKVQWSSVQKDKF